MSFDQNPRVTALNDHPIDRAGRAVVYWMQNAQRARDNAALDAAIELANERGVGVVAFYGVDGAVPHATARTHTFMLDGIRETAADLRERGVGVVIRSVSPVDGIVALAGELRPCAVVTDLSAMRRGRAMRRRAAGALDVPLLEVDSEHVVPLRLVGREHYAARTIRPHIHRHLPRFLVEPARVEPRHPAPAADGLDLAAVPTDRLLDELGIDRSVPPAEDAAAGPRAAEERLDRFLREGLVGYATRRRDALSSGSGLSPYLRFGQIAGPRVALVARAADVPPEDRDAFIEQVVVRRELSSNFVFYNKDYANYAAVPYWAKETLDEHAEERPAGARFSPDDLVAGRTDDALWNASQRELLVRGRIHNFVRIYWGKKFLEWFADPAEALAAQLWINDHHALDGRSPTGYTNIQWIFGKHDRPFFNRPMIGTVRPMTANGMRAKFDVDRYIQRWGGGLGDRPHPQAALPGLGVAPGVAGAFSGTGDGPE